jgi:lysophospholipase L1-like esterase
MQSLFRPFHRAGAALFLLASAASISAADFPLKDGDTWVMAGDSITAQHLHSNYYEAFCFARYPKMTFRFRNSGVGGDTIPKVMARFDWDVAAWKPSVVSVELGMNDQGGFAVEKFIENMGQLDGKIRAAGARPVYFTSSPVNNGDTMAKPGGNTKLHQYAEALKKFSGEKSAPFADQFHAVIDVWGTNKPREILAAVLDASEKLAKDDTVAGVEHLRAFVVAQNKGARPVAMQGDPVHPGPPGQLIMAAALLKELGAEGFVSSATVNVSSGKVEAKGCVVDGVKSEGGKLSFDRLDECLPFPIPDEARAVLPLFPSILALSQYTLKVTGLTGQRYTLIANGAALGEVSAKELQAGVNLTGFGTGPIAAQGRALLAAVGAKEGLVGQWRGQSRAAFAEGAAPDLKQKLGDLTKKVEEADAAIREAAKPKKLHFELIPAK